MIRRLLLIAVSASVLAACQGRDSRSTGAPTPGASVPGDATLHAVPLGAPPGQPVSLASNIANPLEGDGQAIQDGKRLFGSMNCVYCHGPEGAGLMGPSLNNTGWRYGGTPAEIYNSIHDGRPKGMPAWGDRLPPDQIWRLVAYIESLGGASPPATPQMVQLGGGTQSTTGPEPADQSQTDTAAKDLSQANRRSAR